MNESSNTCSCHDIPDLLPCNPTCVWYVCLGANDEAKLKMLNLNYLGLALNTCSISSSAVLLLQERGQRRSPTPMRHVAGHVWAVEEGGREGDGVSSSSA